MKLTCELIKPWLVPYSEGSLRVYRPFMHAAVRCHLRICATCRQAEVLLHRTALTLRRAGRAFPSVPLGRGAMLAPTSPLSSQVLAAIRDDRQRHADRTARWAKSAVSFTTALIVLGLFASLVTQPSLARSWSSWHAFFARSHRLHVAKHAQRRPPFPMHDPFVAPADSSVHIVPVPARALSHPDLRPAHWESRQAIWDRSVAKASPAASTKPASLMDNATTAREAMTAAEAADRSREQEAGAGGAARASSPPADRSQQPGDGGQASPSAGAPVTSASASAGPAQAPLQ